jgi:hypothetical protein
VVAVDLQALFPWTLCSLRSQTTSPRDHQLAQLAPLTCAISISLTLVFSMKTTDSLI